MIPSISSREPTYLYYGTECTVFADIHECYEWVKRLQTDNALYYSLHKLCLKRAPDFHITKIALMYLNMLEEIEHNSLDSFLIDLLNHPSPEVRADVLHKIERLHITAALDAVTQRLALEESPLVLGDTIRTSASLSGAERIDQFLPYIEDKDKNIKKGVMVGLLRSGGIQGVLSAGAELLKMVASKKPEERSDFKVW